MAHAKTRQKSALKGKMNLQFGGKAAAMRCMIYFGSGYRTVGACRVGGGVMPL